MMKVQLLRPYSIIPLLVLVTGLCFMLTAPTAFAHSDLLSSSPAIGDVWEDPPTTVTLLFDEELDSIGSTVQIFSEAGVQIDNGDGGLDLTDINHKTLLVTLPDGLEKGAYTVRWTAVSAADGDKTSGAYAFGIGAGTLVAQPQERVEKTAPPQKNLLLGSVLILFIMVATGFVIHFHENKPNKPTLRRTTKTTQT